MQLTRGRHELLARISRLTLAFFVLVMIGGSGSASKKSRFATHAEVAHVWIGLTSDERSLVRLDLRTDGTGLGGEALSVGEVQLFSISSWTYGSGRIRIATVPIEQDVLEVGSFAGSVTGLTMELTMKGSGWSRSLTLRREGDLEGSWIALKERMAAQGKLGA